jgi:hypothetical protein
MFTGMTEQDRALKIKELEWNAALDAELMKNPNAMPKAVYFIIPNEAAERFCYYGVKPLLKGFLGPNWVGKPADFAAEMVHVFTMMCYFFPLFGAALADSFLVRLRRWRLTFRQNSKRLLSFLSSTSLESFFSPLLVLHKQTLSD